MKIRFPILTFLTLLSIPLIAQSEISFDEYEVANPIPDHARIVMGNFLDDNPMTDIAILHRDTTGTLHLNIHKFQNDGWHLAVEATLDPKILFVDAAIINGKERLITFSDGQLNWFNPQTGDTSPLLKLAFDFRTKHKTHIPQARITHDLNGDGQDDIIAPAADGFWVATQLSDGSFSELIKIGPPEPYLNQSTFDDDRDYGNVGVNPQTLHWYLSRVHNFDYNLDGRKDLVFWNEEHFDVYTQQTDGSFSSEAIPFNTDVHFDSDGTYSIVFSFKESSTFSLVFGTRKSTNHTVLHSIEDMNGDGIPDMVTHLLTGRSVLKMKSRYNVHFGSVEDNKIVFSKNGDTEANSHGKGGAAQSGGYSHQWIKDIDADGQTDIIRYDVKFGPMGIINVFLGRHLTLNLETHRMVDGRFISHPNGKKKIKAHVNIYDDEGGFFPFILLGDLTGDGLSELLVATKKNEIQIFEGQTELDILNQEPRTVNFTAPSMDTGTWLQDLNQDGKDDILLYYHIKEKDRPFRLVTLITK